MGEMAIEAALLAVVDGLIIVQDTYGDEIVAFDLKDCAVQWRIAFSGNDFIGAELADGTIVARSWLDPDGNEPDPDDESALWRMPVAFEAFDASTGEALWSQNSESGYSLSFQVIAGRLVVEGGNRFEVRDLSNGDLLWNDAGYASFFYGQPFVDPEVVIRFDPGDDAAAGSRYVAHDLETGAVLWELPTISGLASFHYPVELHGGSVLLLTWSAGMTPNTYQLVQSADGTVHWPEAETHASSHVIDGDTLYELGFPDGVHPELRAVSLDDGHVVFVAETDALLAPIAVVAGVLVTLDTQTGVQELIDRGEFEGGSGRIALAGFDATSGALLWSHEFDGSEAFDGAWAIEGDEIVYVTDSELRVMNVVTGTSVVVIELPDVAGEYSLTQTSWCPVQNPLDNTTASLLLTEDAIVAAACEASFAVFDRP